jgi:hypothetical protein
LGVGDFWKKREPAIVMAGLALDVNGSGNDELIQVIVHALTAILGGVPIGGMVSHVRGVVVSLVSVASCYFWCRSSELESGSDIRSTKIKPLVHMLAVKCCADGCEVN